MPESPSGVGGASQATQPGPRRPQDGVTWQDPVGDGHLGTGGKEGPGPQRPLAGQATPWGEGSWAGGCPQTMLQTGPLPGSDLCGYPPSTHGCSGPRLCTITSSWSRDWSSVFRLGAEAQSHCETSGLGRSQVQSPPGAGSPPSGALGCSPTAKTSTSRSLRTRPAAWASSWDLPFVTRITTLAASGRGPAAGFRFCCSTWVSARPRVR